jgi:hypothetical protein
MGTNQKRSFTPDETGNPIVFEFEQLSWKLSEYKAAISNPAFAEYVLPHLDAPVDSPDSSIQDLLHQKHYYSGGSARFTFEMRTTDVQENLDRAIKCQPALSRDYVANEGAHSPEIFNRLFSVFVPGQRVFISEYAAIQVSEKVGLKGIRDLLEIKWIANNGSMLGCIFEAYVFEYARSRNEIDLVDENGKKECWSCPGIEIIVPRKLTKDAARLNHWLKPLALNNATWDAVILEPSELNKKEQGVPMGTVKFIQITRASRHDVNLEDCRLFLIKLETLKIFISQEVEFFFIIPKSLIDGFKVRKIDNPGALSKFGWIDDTNTISSRMKKRGIDYSEEVTR